MKRTLICIALTLTGMTCLDLGASAQTAYAFPHSIDMQLGYMATPLEVKGDQSIRHGLSDGSVFDIRYTGFITPHVGLFGELGFAGTDLNEKRYFAVVNRADGYKYRYSTYGFFSAYKANYSPVLKAGVAFRFDRGQLSLRPRAGIGVTGYKLNSPTYTRISQETEESEDVSILMLTSRDYLVDDTNYDRESAFVLTASLQATYTFYEHFYVSVEACVDCIPEEVNFEKSVSSTSYRDDYHSTTKYSSGIPDMLSLKFGIGWNIGWNRNIRRGVPRPVYFR